MANRPSVAPADRKRPRWGGPSTEHVYGFDSLLVLGPGHTKDFKNGNGPCLHGIQHEVGTTKS